MPALSISCRVLLASLVTWALCMTPVTAQTGDPAAASGELPRRAVIRFLTGSEFPPFHYYDDDGVLTGFDVDVARAVCLELAATCDIKDRVWDDLLPSLRRREADAVIASHGITSQALAQVDFTDRYYYTPAWFAGLRTAPKIEVVPEAMAGRKLGVAKGTAHEAYLRAFFTRSSIQTFDTPELAREAVANRAVDFVFDDGVSLVFWLNGTLSKECCELRGGPFFEPRFFGDGIGIAVPKSDVALKGLINQALRRIRETGRYEELMLRYFPNRLY
jgi:polar amino acid transport system substrate-binding protein